ncbi:MAG: hydantoinase B/oxoprolinase family protein, partial [Chloroflexi bacterium]|nr:hydantoinase B/oxoprolinase family protein [Chloroflexota bacterium]
MITQVDPITLEVVSAGITSVVAEMNHSLFHSGYSTIIRESLDGTCGLLTLKGELVGLAVTHPSHLGGFEPGVASVLKEYPIDGMEEGDAYLVNHPYLAGNSHATDTVVVSPIFVDGEPIAFACDIAHKPDIGGLVPGTNSPNAREIFHEGLLVPPVRFYRDRQPVREIMAIVAANSRVPDLVLGDLRGQVGTNFVAERGVRRLCKRYGKDMVLACFEEIIAATERRVRQEVAAWPDGSHEGVGYLDGAYGRPRLKLHCRATVLGDEITLDFSETDDQVEGPLALRPSVGRSITYAALCAMIDPRLWPNHGFDRATKTIFRPGSMLDPIFPAPLNMYSKVAPPLIDVIVAALGHFVPEKLVAAAGGATSNFNLGGRDVRTGRSYVQNEYMITALGGRPGKDG